MRPPPVVPPMPTRVYDGLDVASDFGGEFPWKSRRIDVGGGVQQAVVDEGPRGAPLTFVLLHGNPTWGFLWRRFIEPLRQRYRVVVPDHVGFGRSDKPRDPGYYTLERHIGNLATTLDALDVRNAVPVMQDWGGPIGMGWATRHPDRVAGFAVLNTWAFVREPVMKLPFYFKFLVLGRGGWRRATMSNTFTELFLAKGGQRKLDAATLNAYRAPHPEPGDRVGIARFPQLVPETHDPRHESWRAMAAIEDALPSVADRPALVVWPKGDPAFREPWMRRWAGLFPRLDGPHVVEGRHYVQEDNPEAVLEHLQRWAASVARAMPPSPATGKAPPRGVRADEPAPARAS